MSRTLRETLEQARGTWPDVSVSDADFAAVIERHRPDGEESDVWLERVRAADLYLATACAGGNKAALAHLDRQFLTQIRQAVWRVDPSEAFIDEVRQELRFQLLMERDDGTAARISAYAGRGSLVGWLQVAAARMAVTIKRRTASVAAVDPLIADQFVAEATGPDLAYLRQYYRDDLQTAFRDTMRDLTPRERTILRMHFIDGIPLERLSAMYDVHRTTLGRWVTQACETILSGTRRRLAARLQLPPETRDSIVDLLRSHVDFTASLLQESETLDDPER